MKVIFTARVEHELSDEEVKYYQSMTELGRDEVIESRKKEFKDELIGFGAEEDEIKELEVFVDEGE